MCTSCCVGVYSNQQCFVNSAGKRWRKGNLMNKFTLLRKFTVAAVLMLSSSLAVAADKVLIVVTSHSVLGSINTANSSEKTGYWLGEVTHPYQKLQQAGFDVEIASIQGGEAPVDARSLADKDPVNDWFMADNSHKNKLKNTKKLSQLQAKDYKAVLFAGGHGTMWDFPADTALAKLAADVYQQNGVVAAVCHGPAALLNIKLANGDYLINGKKLTGFSNTEEAAVKLTDVVPFSLEDELVKRGGRFEKAADWQVKVVADERLVTGQNPQSAAKVGEVVVQLLTAK
jgi:putative intracellular protease/amidase